MNTTAQEIVFRDPRAPHQMQAFLEGEFMAALRPQRENGRLVYRGAFRVNGAPHIALLKHELALEGTNVYVLRLELNLDQVDAAHREDALKSMVGWMRLWARDFKPEPLRVGERGNEARRVALEQEAFAAEDRCKTVAEYQRAVVDAMRGGAYFSTAHKEGGSHLRYRNGLFVRQDYGDSEGRTVFASEAAFLEALRKFYQWEVSRGSSPEAPSEELAWRLILRLLKKDSEWPDGSATSHARKAFVIPWLGMPASVSVVLLGVIAVVVVGLLLFNRILASRTIGSPIGESVIASGYVATLIRRQEPSLPSLHRNPARDRYRLDLLLTPLTAQGERRLVTLRRRDLGGNAHLASKLLGQDGHLLWLQARELMAYDLTEHRLVREKEILGVNPALKELLDQSIVEFDGSLRLTTRDQRRAMVLDPATLLAHPVEAESKRGWLPPNPGPESYFSSRAWTHTNQWFGVLSTEEIKQDYQPGYLIPRKAEVGKALSVRRLYSGRITPEKDRARLVDIRPLGDTEYVGAALVLGARYQEPVRLSGPDGFLMSFLLSKQRDAQVVLVRITMDGDVVWRAETPLGTLTQALAAEDHVVLVGERPPEPNRVPEPLAVVVNVEGGSLRAHSLWTKDL